MDELEQNRIDLQSAMSSYGGKYLLEHISSEMTDGIEKFISLPVAQKTSKESYNCQARYDVLKKLKEWIDSEIAMVK